MVTAEVFAKAKRVLLEEISNMDGEEAVNISKSLSKFKEWAVKVLRQRGISTNDIDAIMLKVDWESLNARFDC